MVLDIPPNNLFNRHPPQLLLHIIHSPALETISPQAPALKFQLPFFLLCQSQLWDQWRLQNFLSLVSWQWPDLLMAGQMPTPRSMEGEMLPVQWEVPVVMATCTARDMVLALQL